MVKITRNKILFLLILLLLSISGESRAQNRHNLYQFFNEGGELFSQPGNWKGSDLLKLGLIASASFGIMQMDEGINDYIQENQTLEGTFPIEFGRIWGEPTSWGGISAILFLHGSLTENKANKNLAFEIMQAEAYTIILTSGFKMIFGRARPYRNLGAFHFSPPELLPDENWSYPSGHTSSAFALSTVLADNVNGSLLKAVCYFPAFLTAFARVYENKHWASDVFAGAFLGYFTAKFFTNLHRSKQRLPEEVFPNPLFSFSFSL